MPEERDFLQLTVIAYLKIVHGQIIDGPAVAVQGDHVQIDQPRFGFCLVSFKRCASYKQSQSDRDSHRSSPLFSSLASLPVVTVGQCADNGNPPIEVFWAEPQTTGGSAYLCGWPELRPQVRNFGVSKLHGKK